MTIFDALFSSPEKLAGLPAGSKFGGAGSSSQSISSAIKNAIPSAIAATSAPIIVSSGIISTGAKLAVPYAVTAVKSIVSSAAKSPITSAVAGLIGYGAIKENPEIVTKGVPKVASSLMNIGGNIGKFSKDPTMETAQNIYKENPIVAGGLTILGGALFLKGGSGIVASILNTQAVNKSTKETKSFSEDFAKYLDKSVNKSPLPIPETPTPPPKNSDFVNVPPSSPPLIPDTNNKNVTTTGYTNTKNVSKYRHTPHKTKDINRSIINIRNYNIQASRKW